MKEFHKIVIFLCSIIFSLSLSCSYTYRNKNKARLHKKQNFITLIPGEIDFNNLNRNNENNSDNYRAYYSEKRARRQLPRTHPKFSLPVIIKNFDDELLDFKSRDQLKGLLSEYEKELYKLLLFVDEPKYLKEEDKKLTVNDRYPFAYYNPTKGDKIKRAENLKKKIMQIKTKLGMDPSVEFHITVNNSTFPHNSEDLLNHYEESYSMGKMQINKKTENKEQVINGNFTDLNVIYGIRKTQIMKRNPLKAHSNPFDAIKLPYNNQILDFIKSKHKK